MRLYHADLIAPLNRMEANGSGFYSLLARAWLKADLANSRKLFREFGNVLIPHAERSVGAVIEHAYDNHGELHG